MKTTLPLPVYLLVPGFTLPATGSYYVVTGDGVMLHQETKFFTATTLVKKLNFLEQLPVQLHWHLPPLPAELTAQAYYFFRAVYKKYKSEAALYIFYHEEQKEFMLECTQQTVESAHLERQPPEFKEGYTCIGTMHSHGSMHAFHSSTDREANKVFPGLHITFGRLGESQFQVQSEIVIGDSAFTIPSTQVLCGLTECAAPPKSNFSWIYQNDIPGSKPVAKKIKRKPPQYLSGVVCLVTYQLTEVATQPAVAFPSHWLELVTRVKQNPIKPLQLMGFINEEISDKEHTWEDIPCE